MKDVRNMSVNPIEGSSDWKGPTYELQCAEREIGGKETVVTLKFSIPCALSFMLPLLMTAAQWLQYLSYNSSYQTNTRVRVWVPLTLVFVSSVCPFVYVHEYFQDDARRTTTCDEDPAVLVTLKQGEEGWTDRRTHRWPITPFILN